MINPIKRFIRYWQYKQALRKFRLFLGTIGMDVEHKSDEELLQMFKKGMDRLSKALHPSALTTEETAKIVNHVAVETKRALDED